jgi:tRNA pseudouridine55 synthase
MERSNKFHGILLLDKPHGITSHDAVAKVRKILNQREVGHTGTLDPLATGLMVICLGRATKITQFLAEEEKGYLATIRFGLTSSTYDAEGIEADAVPAAYPETLDTALRATITKFIGAQKQQVPPHASVRLNGRHMYELTRKGEQFERPERDIVIKSLKIQSYEAPVLTVDVVCTKGTYIRSLAHDLGQAVGCGAYLADLRRTSVGRFQLQNAVTLDSLDLLKQASKVEECLVSIDQALDFSALVVSDDTSSQVLHGRLPKWQDIVEVTGNFRSGDTVIISDSRRHTLAIAIASQDSRAIHTPTSNPVDSFVRVLA